MTEARADEIVTERASTKVGLVGCASAKLACPAPARDLYVSPLFRKASAYAEATCGTWFVLSAKHGLLRPDEVVAPYDVKLGRSHRDPAKDAPPIWEWAARVQHQLHSALTDVAHPHLVLLAGAQYRVAVAQMPRETSPLPWPVEEPMRGLGIGERLAWLNTRLTAVTDG